MKKFSSIENRIRKNFSFYIFLRRLAPLICKFIDLEEGFSFSKNIQPINKSLVILDVGSNDGTSIQMFRRYFPNTRIIAVDPIEKPSFRLKNITLIQTALSDELGIRELVTPIINGKRLSQYSSFYKEKMISQICSDMNLELSQVSIQVRQVRFETIDSLDVEPFFIKIDVEGAEIEVLKGAQKVILKFLPVILVEIQDESSYLVIQAFLGGFGYISIDPSSSISQIGRKEGEFSKMKFRGTTNNYLWVVPGDQISWRYKSKN